MFRDLIGAGDSKSAVISFVGAGGKTTALFSLSKELTHQKRLITTTTAIYQPVPSLRDILVIRPNLLLGLDMRGIMPDSVTVWGRSLSPEDKLLGVSAECLKQVYQAGLFDVVLVEADGSKRKPIKAPLYHEPVVPSFSTAVVGVVGLSSLNKPVNDQWVHRVQQFMQLTKIREGELIQSKHLVRLITHANGLFKDIPSTAEKILVLNQADSEWDKNQGMKVIEQLKEKNASVDKFILTSFNAETCKLIWGKRI